MGILCSHYLPPELNLTNKPSETIAYSDAITAEGIMYICDNCKQTTDPKTKAHRIIVETRKRVYQHSAKWLEKRQKLMPEWKEPRTYGTEIVREMTVCPTCATSLIVHHVNSAAD